ncbi:MAG: hypothetical protein LLG43_05235, partial [Deltaproteobacteria bacterium]|nr:hypothetical protein [Deltaproteobacteria bacterium]
MGKHRNRVIQFVITLISAWAILGGLALAADPEPQSAQKAQASVDLKDIFTQIAKATIPAVVHIEVTQQQVLSSSPFLQGPGSPFLFDQPQTQRKFKRELKALGTGVIIDDKGDILTNNHVIEDATDIKVVLSTGKS